jgi:transposase
LLIEIAELGALEPRQAASLASLRWTGRAFIRGGRANVRQAVTMPALVASRFNPDLKAKYKQLINAGKLAPRSPSPLSCES